MRVKTLIATSDTAYTQHISQYISEYHANIIEVSVCNTVEHLRNTLSAKRYDVAFMDADLIKEADLSGVKLPLLLWSHQDATETSIVPGRVIKHRRISKTVSDVLEKYAKVSGNINLPEERAGKITAVWSPAGGVGKTSVALACATAFATEEKEVFYLNLEAFSSIPAYFQEKSKSISAVFEMLGTDSGNVKILTQGICDMSNGIKYLCSPENFDDMSILSVENVRELVTCCADTTDELIVDLSAVCDARTRQVFELADNILLIIDNTDSSQHKLMQFMTQSNVFECIKDKITLIKNKGTTNCVSISEKSISLPHVDSADTQFVYKTLAGKFAENKEN